MNKLGLFALLGLLLFSAGRVSAGTVYTVNYPYDQVATNTINCTDPDEGWCSLRAAIIAANNNPGHDTIVLTARTYYVQIAPEGITETDEYDGDLNIHDDVTIQGEPGVVIQGEIADRVFRISAGLTVNMEQLEITGGNTADHGGAIAIGESIDDDGLLTLTACSIHDNTAGLSGGGIFAQSGVTIQNSHIYNNQANGTYGNGGGVEVAADHADLNITQSWIDGNTAANNGGGVYFSGNILTVENSTISLNIAGVEGGGIQMVGSDGSVRNSTITRNEATQGGGISIRNSSLTMRFSTIVANLAADHGGGILNENDNPLTLQSSILANNMAATSGRDGYGALSSDGYNLIQTTTELIMWPHVDDLYNIDPNLGALLDNGGTTPTHALYTTSAAIDQIPLGSGGCFLALPGSPRLTDQRGYLRAGGTGSGGTACDIGAYEVSDQAALVLAVTETSIRVLDTSQQRLSVLVLSLSLSLSLLNFAGSPSPKAVSEK